MYLKSLPNNTDNGFTIRHRIAPMHIMMIFHRHGISAVSPYQKIKIGLQIIAMVMSNKMDANAVFMLFLFFLNLGFSYLFLPL